MLLESIYLYNFRNHLDQKFTFNSLNNLIIASNGCGKSNLIEAINFFSIARSFKTNVNREVVSFGNKEASLIGEIKNQRKSKLKIIFKEDGSKKIIVDNNVLKKSSDLLKEFTTILISPNDISIIEGSPSIRRKYLDTILFKIDDGYMELMKRYKKVVDIKRKLYKEKIINETLLSIYQEKLEKDNKQIVIKREKLLKELTKEANAYLKKYYPKVGEININYNNTFLNLDLEREIRYHECLYGSHRDDLEISLNKEICKKFSSTGEKRLVSLLLKISEKEIFNKTSNIKPVILIDDAFLGLDDERQRIIYDLIDNDHQKIMTATDDKHIDLIKQPNVIRI